MSPKLKVAELATLYSVPGILTPPAPISGRTAPSFQEPKGWIRLCLGLSESVANLQEDSSY